MRSERFSTGEEIKNELTTICKNEGGPVLHTDKGENFVYAKQGHQLFLGVSGSGKSRKGTLPQTRALIEAGESIVCIDPKGELYKNTACYAKSTHRVSVINFRDPAYSERWNPLSFPHTLFGSENKGLAQQMVQEIVLNLTPENSRNSADRYWVNSERNLLAGLINLLIEYAPKEQCTFTEIQNIITKDWNSCDRDQDDRTISDGLLLGIVEALPPESPAKHLLASYTNLTALTTRSCIMSEVANTISKLSATEDIITMTSNDDLDIASMDVDKPFVIFIILPDDSAIFNALSGLLVSQISKRLIRLADSVYNGILPIRINFILEELGNVGQNLAELPFLMTAARSRNVRISLVLQALGQLDDIYGSSRAETILSCADVWVCFRTTNWDTLSELSRKCGERRIQAGDIRFTQPLLSECQIMAMRTGQALMFISGKTKYIEQFSDYTEIFNCDDLCELPIPKAKKDKKYKPICLVEMKNNILAGKKR